MRKALAFVLFSVFCASVSAPVSAENLSDKQMVRICQTQIKDAALWATGGAKNYMSFSNWKVNHGKDGKANVVTDFDLGTELRVEFTCYFEGNKMVNASAKNKSGERSYDKLKQEFGEALATARISHPGLTEEEFIFNRIGEVEAEYTYIDRNGDVVHAQEYTGAGRHRVGPIRHEPTLIKQRVSNKTYGLNGIKEKEPEGFWENVGHFLDKAGVINLD